MIAPKDSISADPLFPNSERVYIDGVAMREVSLADTNRPDGSTEPNTPVRIYDTSGPWGDPEFAGEVTEGLPALRREWILARGDVEEYEGRSAKPEDNGYLSEEHAERYNENKAAKNRLLEYPGLKRKPLRAKGDPVTQLHYARAGIVTPEMEYIATRENLGRQQAYEALTNSELRTPNSELRTSNSELPAAGVPRNAMNFAHPGQSWGASIPAHITPEFVRDEVARGRAIIPSNINHPRPSR